MTATPTPKYKASTLPRWCLRRERCSRCRGRGRRTRNPQAVSRTSDTTTMERVTSSCPRVNSGTHTRVPRRNQIRAESPGRMLEELDEGAEPEAVDGRQQHQPDDQQIDPVHRCEGSERCPGKCTPHRYCRRAVLPPSVSRHWRIPRRSGGLSLVVAAVVVTASGCGLSGHPRSSKDPRVLGEPTGTTLGVGQPAPPGTGELGAVSCATARRCWAVGIAGPNPAPATGATVITATTNGGVSWKAQHVAGGSTPQLSAASSLALARLRLAWRSAPMGHHCPGSGVVVTTSDAGATWSLASAPRNALVVASVSCASPSDCTAVVSDGTSTWSRPQCQSFGLSWVQEGNFPALFLPGSDLTCMVGGTCIDAGYVPTSNSHGQGAVAVSADAGQTWALATVPSGSGLLQSTACLSSSTSALLRERPRRRSATSCPPRVSFSAARTGDTRGSRRPAQCRSTTSTVWPAPRTSSARWSAPNGSASRPLVREPWRRASMPGSPSGTRRPPTSPSP